MFSELIVGYLFLVGTGAGACLVLAIMGLCVPRAFLTRAQAGHSLAGYGRSAAHIPDVYSALFFPPYLAALALLVVGMVCLMAHLGHTDRLLLLVTQPRLSYITVGAYALALCVVLTVAVLLIWKRFLRLGFSTLRVLQVLLAIDALVVMTYTGLFLASMRSVPLWSTPWLPALFLLSSVSCGVGLVSIVCHLSPAGRAFSSSLRRLVVSDALAIALESFVLIVMAYSILGTLELALQPDSAPYGAGAGVLFDWGRLNNTDLALMQSVWNLVLGSYAQLFWFALVVVGLVIPFVLDVLYVRTNRPHRGMVLAASLCVLVGGYALRHCVVLAGIQPALIVTGVM